MDGSPDTWQAALTRRLRTLVRTAPLHRIEASKGQRAIELADQDLRALALRALDLTIEQMGLGSGATIEELCAGLRPMVLACQPGIDLAAAEAIAAVVVEALLNDRDRRQAFREDYLGLDDGRPERRAIQFHLLREHALPDGAIVLKASTEAINLYAGMLEYPVEDAQIAEEAVLRAQVARGRIADAVRTAQRARIRSIEYEQKLLGVLETARRDVQQVDWVREVLGLLDQARQHLDERLATERDLIAAVETRLETAQSPPGPPAGIAARTDSGRELAQLRDTLEECKERHLRLHARVIPANQQYLEEQDRQFFRPRALAPSPDLEADVLRPALGLPVRAIAGAADRLLAWLSPPRPPVVVHLPALVARLLAPPRDDEGEDVLLPAPELEAVVADAPRFSAADRRAVGDLLSSLGPNGERLSHLLAAIRRQEAGAAAEALLVLESLLAFGGRAGRPTSEPAGQHLDDPRFAGDDLIVRRET